MSNGQGIDGCSIDGDRIHPGVYPTPIDVTNKLICPVFQDRDSSYLGCLSVKREEARNRHVPILQSLDPAVILANCHRG